MDSTKKTVNCLICGARVNHSHLGIDSCRACAIFYKRTVDLKQQLVCRSGDNLCRKRGTITSCRKCRFDRFKDIYARACATEITETIQEDDDISDSEQCPEPRSEDLSKAVDEQSPIFIDHNCTLCTVRKASEMSSLNHKVLHDQLRTGEMVLIPSKYSMLIPTSQMFLCGVMDFARFAFADFRNLSNEDRHSIIRRNFQLIQSLDGSYRAHYHFPKDDTVSVGRTFPFGWSSSLICMATYMTFVNGESLNYFFDNCPNEINKAFAIEQFRTNMKRTINMTKSQFLKVKPSVDEFIALFGLSIWNDYTSSLSPELAEIASKNRALIMEELHKLYKRKNVTNYAVRLGELLCLLTNEERVLDLTNEDIELYRTMNIFNEAYT